MQKVKVFFIIALMAVLFTAFRNYKKEKIKWFTIVELQAEYTKNPRPILIDVYTGWCGWCKVMDRETYTNDNVVSYVNEHYYAVKLDAEIKDSVLWGNRKFGYNPDNRVNDLAVYLLGGQMSYPTTVFLPALTDRPAPLAGYLKPNEIEAPLKFFGDGAYKTKNFPEFMKTFNNNW
jgi:thioredoxin-related protein